MLREAVNPMSPFYNKGVARAHAQGTGAAAVRGRTAHLGPQASIASSLIGAQSRKEVAANSTAGDMAREELIQKGRETVARIGAESHRDVANIRQTGQTARAREDINSQETFAAGFMNRQDKAADIETLLDEILGGMQQDQESGTAAAAQPVKKKASQPFKSSLYGSPKDLDDDYISKLLS